ncbi:hypothetical protein HYH03_007975 [Edaphochlamys debaryana]|uniref:Uncharacterized protein n=1 Tax=Edaphochlamys debaryana TaxID=47281 RepID=A0A836BZU4_9CHLO|nr:hypothetical protein HYH03_007975 [Edaphochlamys debaryana]|eukprot:KAG2493753.1 hypothetical protein HYH03_007975 [Edaphochlamys debaryana]
MTALTSTPPDNAGAAPMGVTEALAAMQAAVRSGEIPQARLIGERCVMPLSITAGELAMSGKLSQGAESTVFRGTWRGQPVAVKKARIATSADLDRFRRELAILHRIHHPSVIPLLGARALPPDYLLVLPLAAGGSLRSALHEAGWRPAWSQVVGMALQMAAGMEAVHAAGVLHRDIKPANVLLLEPFDSQPPSQPPTADATGNGPAAMDVDTDGAAAAGPGQVQGRWCPRVQLVDFGIADVQEAAAASGPGAAVDEADPGGSSAAAAAAAKGGKPSGGFYKRQMIGTLEYMAPELLLRTAPASTASDVYAWAVAVNEMATGIVPFSDCTKDNPEVHTVLEMGYGRQELAAAVCAEGLRPLLPRPCPPGFAALMRSCWELKPEDRPAFVQVRGVLERLLREELPAWEEAQRQPKLKGRPQGVVVDATAMVVDLTVDATGNGQALAASLRVGNGHVTGANGAANGAATQPDPDQSLQPPFELCAIQQQPIAVTMAGAEATEGCIASWLQSARAGAGANGLGQANGHTTAPPTATTVGTCFNSGAFEAIGPRDSMEDRYLLLSDLWNRQPPAANDQPSAANRHPQHEHEPRHSAPPPQPCTPAALTPEEAAALPEVPLVAVIDGHRGAEAADFCRARLSAVLREEVRRCGSPGDALARTFLRLEEEYWAHWRQQRALHAHLSRGPHAFPGATLLACLRAPDGCLYVANAGDCRAVLVRRRRALAASRDHTGLLVDERRRLAEAGLHVGWSHGGWRIGSTGLQVTRCIGDFDVKQRTAAATGPDNGPGPAANGPPPAEAARGPALPEGVTALPEVSRVALEPGADHFLILGSDGLWDVMSGQEAAGLVYDTVKDPTMAAKRLVCEALMRGSADNVTALVIFLTPDLTTLERVYDAEGGEAFAATSTAYGSRVRAAHDRHVGATMDELRDTY